MRLFIDADGCPVVDITVAVATSRGIAVTILCDTAHRIERSGTETIVVSKGPDSVDFKLVNLLKPGDIVVTQDYGLAAMCLARGALPLSQNGLRFTGDNIDALLLSRHTARQVRKAGGRLRGPAKRTTGQDRDFERALSELIDEQIRQKGVNP